jgi:hypothetical protein
MLISIKQAAMPGLLVRVMLLRLFVDEFEHDFLALVLGQVDEHTIPRPFAARKK